MAVGQTFLIFANPLAEPAHELRDLRSAEQDNHNGENDEDLLGAESAQGYRIQDIWAVGGGLWVVS